MEVTLLMVLESYWLSFLVGHNSAFRPQYAMPVVGTGVTDIQQS